MDRAVDVAIVGAGAAGLATAIFLARRQPAYRIVLVDGARTIGAKILVSGGGRCNVTNRVVKPEDFQGGDRKFIRRVLFAFDVGKTIKFFDELGVLLHEEENGQLFPDSQRSKAVLDALLNEVNRLGVRLCTSCRIRDLIASNSRFELRSTSDTILARKVVLATGGKSLPKTGSDGGGYALAQSLGHSLVPCTPALVPMVLEGDFHRTLSGVSHEAELMIHVSGERLKRLRGSMLWTHFGVSGPLIMGASRHWHQARLSNHEIRWSINFFPGLDFKKVENAFLETAQAHPRWRVQRILAQFLPERLSRAILNSIHFPEQMTSSHLTREQRRDLVHALVNWHLSIQDSRGYNYAEVTAGGISLGEIDPATMQSRLCRGLYFVGEILDVDGRIGGFNFQWAWSSAWVTAQNL